MIGYHWLIAFVIHAFHVRFRARFPQHAITPVTSQTEVPSQKDRTHQAGIRFLADWSNSVEFGIYL